MLKKTRFAAALLTACLLLQGCSEHQEVRNPLEGQWIHPQEKLPPPTASPTPIPPKQPDELKHPIAEKREKAPIRKKPATATITQKDSIYFDFNQFTPQSGQDATINKIVAKLTKQPNMKIIISGHTDAVGSETYNLQLSLARATTIQQILIEKGVAQSRTQLVGRGEKDGEGLSDPARRRVDIHPQK